MTFDPKQSQGLTEIPRLYSSIPFGIRLFFCLNFQEISIFNRIFTSDIWSFCHFPITTLLVLLLLLLFVFVIRQSFTLRSIVPLEKFPSIPVNEILNLVSGKIKSISNPKSINLIPLVFNSVGFLFTKIVHQFRLIIQPN